MLPFTYFHPLPMIVAVISTSVRSHCVWLLMFGDQELLFLFTDQPRKRPLANEKR